jgi:hypothetical protein
MLIGFHECRDLELMWCNFRFTSIWRHNWSKLHQGKMTIDRFRVLQEQLDNDHQRALDLIYRKFHKLYWDDQEETRKSILGL